MSTLTQALAHMNQLVDLGATAEEALNDACVAYELEGDSAEALETMFDEQYYEYDGQPTEYEEWMDFDADC